MHITTAQGIGLIKNALDLKGRMNGAIPSIVPYAADRKATLLRSAESPDFAVFEVHFPGPCTGSRAICRGPIIAILSYKSK